MNGQRLVYGTAASASVTPTPESGANAPVERWLNLYWLQLRFVLTRFGGVARLRAFWHYFLRRYRYEMCKACGRPVNEREGREPLSWWHAPDALWMEVVGDEANILCKSCFSCACDESGISIMWQPVVEHRR